MTQEMASVRSFSNGSGRQNRACLSAGDGGSPPDRHEGQLSIDSFDGQEESGGYRKGKVDSGLVQQPDQVLGCPDVYGSRISSYRSQKYTEKKNYKNQTPMSETQILDTKI